MTQIGPYSRPDALRKMDGRTWEAKLLKHVRAELVAHVGGTPSATQKALIDRAAWLSLHVAQIDQRTADGRQMTEHDSRTYLAWSNSLARTLKALGLKGVAQQGPDLKTYLAARSREPAT